MPDQSPNSRFAVRSPDRTQQLRALVLCCACTERRVVEIHRGERFFLERDGTLHLDCSACGGHTPHTLIRFGL